MKLRKLRKRLNDTKYILNKNGDCLCVGSPLCPDLIQYDPARGKLSYALSKKLADSGNEELIFIWNTLERLIESGEIQDFLNGNDEIEKPLPVFRYAGNEIRESCTDVYGWPNIDSEGNLMYNNTHFRTREECREYAMKELMCALDYMSGNVRDSLMRLQKSVERIRNDAAALRRLRQEEVQTKETGRNVVLSYAELLEKVPGGADILWEENSVMSRAFEVNGEAMHEEWGENECPLDALFRLYERARKAAGDVRKGKDE